MNFFKTHSELGHVLSCVRIVAKRALRVRRSIKWQISSVNYRAGILHARDPNGLSPRLFINHYHTLKLLSCYIGHFVSFFAILHDVVDWRTVFVRSTIRTAALPCLLLYFPSLVHAETFLFVPLINNSLTSGDIVVVGNDEVNNEKDF